MSRPLAAPRPPRWLLVRPPRRHRPSGRLAAPSRSRARPSGAPFSPSTAILGWAWMEWPAPSSRGLVVSWIATMCRHATRDAARAGGLDNLFHAHVRVAKKPRQPRLPGTVAAQRANRDATLANRHETATQKRPPFSRRTSPNRPRPYSIVPSSPRFTYPERFMTRYRMQPFSRTRCVNAVGVGVSGLWVAGSRVRVPMSVMAPKSTRPLP